MTVKHDGGIRLVVESHGHRRGRAIAFSRTLEAYKEGQNKNSVLILTTDSDYYRYLKDAAGRKPGPARAAR